MKRWPLPQVPLPRQDPSASAASALPAPEHGRSDDHSFPWWWVAAGIALIVGAVVAVGLVITGGRDGDVAEPTISTALSGEGSDPAGVTFDDPQGAYTMTIASDWDRLPGAFVEEVES